MKRKHTVTSGPLIKAVYSSHVNVYDEFDFPLSVIKPSSGLQNFKTFNTSRWQGSQSYAPATFTPMRRSWYSFLSEAESTPGT